MRKNLLTTIAMSLVALCSVVQAGAQERNGNRMIMYKGADVLKTYAVDEVDSIKFDYVENKKVEIELLSVESNAAKVKFTKPDECDMYYVAVIPADSKEDLMQYAQSSYVAKLKESSEYEYTNLKAGVKYIAIALAVDKYGITTVLSTIDFTTAASGYTEITSQYFDVDYWGDAYKNGYQNFIIRLGDCPHSGVLIKGLGKLYNFSIYSKNADGSVRPAPVPGTYTYYSGDKPIDMCMEATESLLFVSDNFNAEDDYSLTQVKYKDATLSITKNADGTYLVRAMIVLETGEKVALNYTGNYTYRDMSFKGYDGPTLDHDITFNCDYITAYDMAGQCFEMMDGGDPAAEGASWFGRNRVTIFLDADADGMPRLGTFPVTDDGANGTVRKGYYKDFGGGVSGSDGTIYYYRESLKAESIYGFVDSGTVTISKDDATGDYTISTHFKTDKGFAVNATYKGPFKSNKSSAAQAKAKRMPSALAK